MGITRDELVARLTRAGELELSGEQAETDSYFDTDQFRFHGPASLETDYAGLMSYFVWDLLNIFRFDDQGQLVEEWVRTDNESFLRQLGAPEK